MNISAEQILKGFNYAKADRLTVDNTWEDIIYYTVPYKRGIQSTVEPGEKPPFDVYDDTAQQSNIILAAGLSGYMTNASQRWFELRSRDEYLMNDREGRSFFGTSTEVVFSAYANTNFYQETHELYLDIGALGNGALYSEEDDKEDVRFYARHPKEIYLVENDKGTVDMVYRYFKMTSYQAYTFFGKDKCGETIRKCVEEQNDHYKSFDFIHYVCPRFIRIAGRADSQNKPFASYWVSEADKKILKEGGYDEFPFSTPRFYKNSTEAYGYGPAHSAYCDIRMLNKMMELYIKSGELSIGGPFLMEEDGVIGTLDLRYNAINYQKQPLSQGRAVEPLFPNGRGNPQIALEFINRTEGKIKAAFFTDLFLMLNQAAGQRTATEVLEMAQEKMLILGPVLGRLQSELLNPVIIRTFNILLRRGKLPKVPQALINKQFDVVYVSPLAKAQRALQARDMTTFLSVIGQMVQMAPDIFDKIDTDTVVDKMSRVYSVDPEIIRGDEVVEAIREGRAQAQQAQAQVAGVAQMAEIGKVASEADRNMRQ
jgi:hypothetical protein